MTYTVSIEIKTVLHARGCPKELTCTLRLKKDLHTGVRERMVCNAFMLKILAILLIVSYAPD